MAGLHIHTLTTTWPTTRTYSAVGYGWITTLTSQRPPGWFNYCRLERIWYVAREFTLLPTVLQPRFYILLKMHEAIRCLYRKPSVLVMWSRYDPCVLQERPFHRSRSSCFSSQVRPKWIWLRTTAAGSLRDRSTDLRSEQTQWQWR